ncbi:unnamed protein product [Peniophora sp. CBMAI 1063]|nr:unnamed protein product [Peniophora sp. CBMAI 1063]
MSSSFNTPLDADPDLGPKRLRIPQYAIYHEDPNRMDVDPVESIEPLPGGSGMAIDFPVGGSDSEDNLLHSRDENLKLYNEQLASIHQRLELLRVPESAPGIDRDVRLKLDATLTRGPLDVKELTALVRQSKDLGLLSYNADLLNSALTDPMAARIIFYHVNGILPRDHPNRSRICYLLGSLLRERFELQNELEDLEAAIIAFTLSIRSPFFNHASPSAKCDCLYEIGISYYYSYQRKKDLRELGYAIDALRYAADWCHDKPQRGSIFALVGRLFHNHAKRSDDVGDMDYAIYALERAAELLPANDPTALAQCLRDIGAAYLARFKATKKRDSVYLEGDRRHRTVSKRTRQYLERGIEAYCRAITLLPAGHALEQSLYRNFGSSLRKRGICIGEPDARTSTQDNVEVYQRVALYTQMSHPDWPRLQAEYGKALVNRFTRDGQPLDIERAVEVYGNLFEHMPHCYDDVMLLHEMGVALHLRFETSEEWADLMSALRAHERAVELAPDSHREKSRLLDGLAMTWQTRYIFAPEMEYIDSAVSAHQRAIELALNEDSKKGLWLCHYGTSLRIRYDQSEDIRDLERAVAMHDNAWTLVPESNPLAPEVINELGLSLLERFKYVQEAHRNTYDVVRSVSAHRYAVQFAGEKHPKRLTLRRNLGHALRYRFQHVDRDDKRKTFKEAIDSFMDFAPDVPGYRAEHLTNAAACASMLSENRDFCSQNDIILAWTRFMDGFETEAAWLGHTVHRRFRGLSRWGRDVATAVAAALEGNEPQVEQAAEWLEAGRAMIWSQVLSLRDRISLEIWQHDAGMALQLRQYTRAIQEDVYAPLSATMPERSFEDLQVKEIPSILRNPRSLHRRRVLDYEAVLESIREHEEFEDFRRRKSVLELLRSPHAKQHLGGYIVFLTVHETRSDAIVIVPGENTSISSTRLQRLTYKTAERVSNAWAEVLWKYGVTRERGEDPRAPVRPEADSNVQKKLHKVLKILWDYVVYPVLQFIESEGLQCQGMPGRLPHITWCPSGALTELPLHAAGDYEVPSGPRAYNCFVSSYAPSLSALIRGSEQAFLKRSQYPSALIVTQPNTPNHTPLPCTEKERVCLQNILARAQIPYQAMVHREATVLDVQGAIDLHSWLHLACHGKQEWNDPLKSAFALYDGPLSIPDVMRTAGEKAELAFLSACQTARGDLNLKEEASHLAAGMLAVGFCAVVGTMWSIGDADAPIVVEAFYTKLIEMRNQDLVGVGETGAAYALHEAVGRLREQVGESKIVKWAPFVHYGV